MEKGTVLVVLEGVVDLLIPYHTPICGRDIHQLDPERVSDQVVGQHDCPLQTGVGPSIAVGMGNVETSNGDSLNLVGGLWNGAFDSLFVSLR